MRYDTKLPDHFPANPNLGGKYVLFYLLSSLTSVVSVSMIALIDAAKSYGNRIALHENYVDMYLIHTKSPSTFPLENGSTA